MNYIQYISITGLIFFQLNVLSQTSIKFEKNSTKVDENVLLQVKRIYNEAMNNSEILNF